MARPTVFTRLYRLLFNKKLPAESSAELFGNQYGLSYAAVQRRRYNLDIDEPIVRPIKNDLAATRELAEMKQWSYEVRHSILRLSSDCFQQQDGLIGSWSVAKELIDGYKVNKDVIAIASEISNRYNGKTPVLGGNRLEQCAREMLWSGDSFLELAIEREGISKNDWCITRSLHLPPLTMFADEDQHGEVGGYWQRKSISKGGDDVYFHPVKMLHFKYKPDGLYGNPLIFQNLEAWRKLKAAAADEEDAGRAVGAAPWLHIFPPTMSTADRTAYQRDYEADKTRGIVTDLFLSAEMDVRKAVSDSNAIAPLVERVTKYRYQMIPPGIPYWFFPGLGMESSAAKDLNGQPAMTYARMVADLRAILGEQIRWAIAVEIVLKKGFDWFVENGRFDIVWGEWFTSPIELQAEAQKKDTKKAPQQGDAKEFILNGKN